MEDRSPAKVGALRQEGSLREAILIQDTAQLLDRRQVATSMTTDTDISRGRRETSSAPLIEA